MKEFKTFPINQNPFDTPEHLVVLGIEVCQECGKAKSIDNTICYNCGFGGDDKYLNEDALNRKYLTKKEIKEDLYLVVKESERKREKNEYHLMRGGFTLCGLSSKKRNKFIDLGMMRINKIPTLYKNPCQQCMERVDDENI